MENKGEGSIWLEGAYLDDWINTISFSKRGEEASPEWRHRGRLDERGLARKKRKEDGPRGILLQLLAVH